MELVRSNRPETLADALAENVRQSPLPPFHKEAVVVQSRGVAHWLTLDLARKLGVWANPCFPFPRTAIEHLLQGIEGGSDDEEWKHYDRTRLKWTIARMLSGSAPPELEAYLGTPADPDRIVRFASAVANVFDDYVVYRPDLLDAWVGGKQEGWQSALWKRLADELGPHDLASRMASALRVLRSEGLKDRDAYQRLHLFSLETLPPSFLRFFAALSEHVPTTLYLLEPSSEYLGDVEANIQLSLPTEELTGDGHPFLEGVGRLSRDFQQLVIEAEGSFQSEATLFVAPECDTLLGCFQSDVLNLRKPPHRDERARVSRSDRSISTHACTSPMREVQVVWDQIHSALEADDSLRPEHVAVMTSDLDTYAPLFRAVLGESSEHAIPFDVHDRRSRDDAPFYEDFLMVLEVLDSRFSVLDVVRLMDATTLRSELRFSVEERARLTELLASAGVRWGIDAEHRAQQGFPGEAIHTWRAGLSRLFLGFSCEPDAADVFADLLPRGAPSLEDAALVARMAHLCDALFDFQRRTEGRLPVDRWASELEQLCTLLFSEDEDSSRPFHLLRTALEELRESMRRSGFTGRISLRTLARELASSLVDRTPAVGFLRRGVTLTELVPLRSVPFRMVCLLGLSEEAFPRSDDRPSFDLTRGEHRLGDRNKRHDDRHSFLQAILCARDRVVITYSAPAQSRRVAPNPSPVVWELTETLNRYYRAEDDEAPLIRPTIHPMHPFDSRYFDGESQERSFSEHHLRIARALDGAPAERPRIELVAEGEETPSKVVSVDELATWLWDPNRAFVDYLLRAHFEQPELYEPSGALVRLGPLEAAAIGNDALRRGLEGDALAEYLDAAPEFPDGTPGTLARRRLAREIGALTMRAKAFRRNRNSESRSIGVEVGDGLIEGRIRGLHEDMRLVERFTRPHRKSELLAWVEHLLMQASDDPRLPTTTTLVLRGDGARPCVVSYRDVAQPRDELAHLLSLYRASRRSPLPLFGSASWDYAESFAEGTEERAVNKARDTLSSERAWNPRLEYLFGARDPFDDASWSEEFANAATAVYGPFLAHRSEE